MLRLKQAIESGNKPVHFSTNNLNTEFMDIILEHERLPEVRRALEMETERTIKDERALQMKHGILRLPNELLLHLASYLGVRDLFNFTHSFFAAYNVCKNDGKVWRQAMVNSNIRKLLNEPPKQERNPLLICLLHTNLDKYKAMTWRDGFIIDGLQFQSWALSEEEKEFVDFGRKRYCFFPCKQQGLLKCRKVFANFDGQLHGSIGDHTHPLDKNLNSSFD